MPRRYDIYSAQWVDDDPQATAVATAPSEPTEFFASTADMFIDYLPGLLDDQIKQAHYMSPAPGEVDVQLPEEYGMRDYTTEEMRVLKNRFYRGFLPKETFDRVDRNPGGGYGIGGSWEEDESAIRHNKLVPIFEEYYRSLTPAQRTALQTGKGFRNFMGFTKFLSKKGWHFGEIMGGFFGKQDMRGTLAAHIEALENVTREGTLGERVAAGLAAVPSIALEFFIPGSIVKKGKALVGIAKAATKTGRFAQGVGTSGLTFGLHEAMQAPREGETLAERSGSIGKSTAIGAGIGALAPLKAAQIPAAAAGFGGMTWIATGGDVDATIETIIPVLGFGVFGLTQGAGRYTRLRWQKYKAGKNRTSSQDQKFWEDIAKEQATDIEKIKAEFRRTGEHPGWARNKYVFSPEQQTGAKPEVKAEPKKAEPKTETVLSKKEPAPLITTPSKGAGSTFKLDTPDAVVNRLSTVKADAVGNLSTTVESLGVATEAQKQIQKQVSNEYQVDVGKNRDGTATIAMRSIKPEVTLTPKEALDNAMKSEKAMGAKATTKKAVRKIIKGEPQKEVTLTSKQLLEMKLDTETKGAKRGYRAGVLNMKANVKEAVDFIKEHLPMKLRGKALATLKGVSTPTGRKRVYEAVNRIQKHFEHQTAVDTLKKTIGKAVSKIGKRLRGGGLNPTQSDQLKVILDAITTQNLTEARIKRLEGLKEHLETMRDEAVDDFDKTLVDTIVSEGKVNELDLLGKSPIKKMTLNQLRSITDEINRLIALSQTFNRLRITRGVRDAKKVIGEAVSSALGARDNTKKNIGEPSSRDQSRQKGGIGRTIFNLVAGSANSDIKTLAYTITGGKSKPGEATWEILDGNLAEGTNDKNELVLKGQDYIRKAFADAGYKQSDWARISPFFYNMMRSDKLAWARATASKFTAGKIAPPAKKKYTLAGQSVKLSRGDVMALAMHSRSAYNLGEIVDHGLAWPREKIGMVTANEIKAIVNTLTKAETKLVDAVTYVFEHIIKPTVNKVSRRIEGIDKLEVPNYFEAERFRKEKLVGAMKFRVDLIENQGRFKDRVGGDQPLVLRDIFEVLKAALDGTAEYVGLAEPLRTARMLVNNQAWQDAVDSKGYRQERQFIFTLLRRIQEPARDDSTISRWIFQPVLRGFVKGILAEPRIFVSQYTSTANYFVEHVPAKYVTKLRVVKTEKILGEINKHWATGRMRIEGGLSSVSLGELARGDAVSRAFAGKGDVSNIFVAPIHFFDMMAISEGWRLSKAMVEGKEPLAKAMSPNDTLDFAMGLGEYWTTVRRLADFLVRTSQPMFDIKDRSVFTSDPHASSRQFVMFRSYTDKALQQLQRALVDLRNKRIGPTEYARRVGIAWSSFSTNVLIRAAVAFAIYDNRTTLKDLSLDIITSPIRLLAFFGYAFQKAVTENVKVATGESPKWSTRSDFDGVAQGLISEIIGIGKNSYGKAVGQAFAGDNEKAAETFMVALNKSWVVAGLLVGLPTPAIQRFIRGRIEPKEEKKSNRTGRPYIRSVN